ncbi:cytochrome b/b6 domain-containing protein [Yaniella halotolerans]|uniref:cytochrome b/b6 domain-containing protein n=1 Tax=Yaniella halotolerans TaxID=225453 RepID=UPI0003B43152|nr:cytochrome b/b6 domain-containing protein [Yaniella halotolerans]
MSKRRMVGWQPLAVENTDAPTPAPADTDPQPPVEPVTSEQATSEPTPAPAAPVAEAPVEQPAEQPAANVQAPASSGPVQDPAVARRRMAGWQPLTVANTAAPDTVAGAAPSSAAEQSVASSAEPAQTQEAPEQAITGEVPAQTVQSSGPIQDPDVPRRRMAGWRPLSVAHDGPPAVVASGTAWPQAGVAESEPVVAAETAPAQEAVPAGSTNAAPAPVTEDLPRRRMQGWQPLAVGHPDSIASPAVTKEPPVADPQPAKQRMDSPTPETAPVKQRMGAPAASSPVAEPEVKMPEVVTPPPAAQPAATETVEKDVVRQPSKLRKALLSLLGVALVAAGVVLLAQWLRTLDPVAEFIGTYDGTPTHRDGVTAGIPGWVGWQHFFNFFIMVMVIRSGFLIRNQERPEAYWTPNAGGFYSPGKKNTPQKVSIQQWIHQSFNVLWVANGLFFYIMVFATGHWMRIVPTNWDIFPNIVSAGLQYVSLDWPEEHSWVYYNALQIMTYFLTVFVAAPLAVLTGLRLSTWWPQHAGINKAFSLPVARKIHFGTMVYFIVFILVHLFLVFTTGILSNLNMMFTARDAGDWWGIGVFAVSVAVTVGVAWLIKPIFISPIAEKTGKVSTR